MTGLSIKECDTNLDIITTGPEFLELTEAQLWGEACAVCHARWPRPRILLGLLDGEEGAVYGCTECAELHRGEIAWSDSASSSVPALASL